MQWLKIATKLTYLGILVAITVIPTIAWIRNPLLDISAFGAFAAGVGVPMGTLTVAMAASGIGKAKANGGGGAQ